MNKKKIVIGICITFLVLIIFVIFPLFLEKYIEKYITLDIYYSLGQLFFDILIIPIAIIGFYMTYNEFQKGQDKAELRLYWENGNSKDDQILSVKCKKDSNGKYYIDSNLPIVLINNGNIIPSQYLVVLETNWNINNDNIRPLIVKNILSDHWKGDNSSGKYSLKFYSHSKFPTFPNTPQTLCSIGSKRDLSNPTYIENTSIIYTIYSDKSNKVTGTLLIEITDFGDELLPLPFKEKYFKNRPSINSNL